MLCLDVFPGAATRSKRLQHGGGVHLLSPQGAQYLRNMNECIHIYIYIYLYLHLPGKYTYVEPYQES